MPVVRKYYGSFAANQTTKVDLSPYDRFGQRGGRVTVGATASANPGEIELTALVGSDQLAESLAIGIEEATGVGVTTQTPTVSGFGAPADPITVRLTNTAANTPNVVVQVNIENA